MDADIDLNYKIETIKFFLNDEKTIRTFEDNFTVLDSNLPLAFNYFCLGVRAIIDDSLRKFSPATEVKKTSWYYDFAFDNETRDGVTTKQKLAYIICGNHSIYAIEKIFPITEKINELYSIYHKLNKYVHLGEIPQKTKWLSLKEEVVAVIFEFVSTYNHIYEQLGAILKIMEEATLNYMEEDGFRDLLESLATHVYSPTASLYNFLVLETNEIKDSLGHRFEIKNQFSGTASADFQIGSDRDVSRGDGTTFHERHKFIVVAKLTLQRHDNTLYPISIQWLNITPDYENN